MGLRPHVLERPSGSDVADALIEHVPVEAGLEFGAVVGLDLFDLEGQS